MPDEEVITLGKSNLLIHAAYLGQFQVVDTLLPHADLRAVAENGGNVVDWLCFRSDSRADFLASILQKWTNKFGESDMKSMLNSTRMKQGTPLMCAVFAPNVTVTELLLRWESESLLRQSTPVSSLQFGSWGVHSPNICWSSSTFKYHVCWITIPVLMSIPKIDSLVRHVLFRFSHRYVLR